MSQDHADLNQALETGELNLSARYAHELLVPFTEHADTCLFLLPAGSCKVSRTLCLHAVVSTF